MKKYIHTLLGTTALTLTLVACSGEVAEPGLEAGTGTLPDGTPQSITITAVAGGRDAAGDAPATRISYDEAPDGTRTHILWSAQEQFALCYTGGQMEIPYLFAKDGLEADVPSATFTYNGSDLNFPPQQTLYAVYPGTPDIMGGAAMVEVNFLTQTDNDKHLMIATLDGSELEGSWDNAHFTFRTRVALLKLTLTHAGLAGQTLSNITLQAGNLYSRCEFNLAEDRWTTHTVAPGGITINTSVTADALGKATLYVAQPPSGAPTGEITITATAGGKDYSGTLASGTFEDYYVYTAPEVPMSEAPAGYDYAVRTPADLIALATAVNQTGGSDGNLPGTTIPAATARIIQMADIDMPAGTNWEPIGNTSARAFAGTYNGGGYTIANLRTAVNYWGDAAGLFGYVQGTDSRDAVLTGIHLQDCYIANTYTGGSTGALAGCTGYAVISGCSATGSVEGHLYVGGLIGEASRYAYLTRSNSACTVTNQGTYMYSYTGGLIGRSSTENYIVACTASGQVTVLQNAGGLVGYSYTSTIAFSYATGNITAQDQSAGYAAGFIAYSYDSIIRNCYATGTPSGVDTRAFTVTSSSSTIVDCHPYGGNTTGTPGAIVRTAYSLANIKTVRTTGFAIEVINHTFTQANAWASATDEYPTLNYNL